MNQSLGVVLLLVGSSALAADPATSVYQLTTKDSKENKASIASTQGADLKRGHWAFFTFGETDKVLGSLAVENSADSQTIKFNAINYYIWFGGNKYLPFQLYLGQTQAKGQSTKANDSTTGSLLVDPEAGVALKFPVLFTYQSAGDGFCAFLSDKNKIGHCSVGGDFTISFKDVKDQTGEAKTISGATIRFGAAVLFPILDEKKEAAKGYVSLAARVIASRFNDSDSSQLFAPVSDAAGNPVKFKGTIAAAEIESKWKFDQSLAIGLRWVSPLNNKDYLKRETRLSLETQF